MQKKSNDFELCSVVQIVEENKLQGFYICRDTAERDTQQRCDTCEEISRASGDTIDIDSGGVTSLNLC